MQWPNFFSIESTNNYSNRCFPDRVGSSLHRDSNIKTVVRGRENPPHKCARTASNKIGSIFLHQRVKAIHFQIDNKAALSYLLKMGGTKNEHMTKLSGDIWHYLLNQNMSITVEYLPSVMNTGNKKKQTLQSGFFIPKFFKRFLDH